MSSSSLPYPAELDLECSIEELDYLESRYMTEKEEYGTPSIDTQFIYCWALIRSRYKDDQQRGIHLLQDLEGKIEKNHVRDCWYYSALAHYRLGNYGDAKRQVNKILRDEPENQQALSLLNEIERKLTKEGVIGLALVGGVAAAIAGLAFAWMKSSNNKN